MFPHAEKPWTNLSAFSTKIRMHHFKSRKSWCLLQSVPSLRLRILAGGEGINWARKLVHEGYQMFARCPFTNHHRRRLAGVRLPIAACLDKVPTEIVSRKDDQRTREYAWWSTHACDMLDMVKQCENVGLVKVINHVSRQLPTRTMPHPTMASH